MLEMANARYMQLVQNRQGGALIGGAMVGGGIQTRNTIRDAKVPDDFFANQIDKRVPPGLTAREASAVLGVRRQQAKKEWLMQRDPAFADRSRAATARWEALGDDGRKARIARAQASRKATTDQLDAIINTRKEKEGKLTAVQVQQIKNEFRLAKVAAKAAAAKALYESIPKEVHRARRHAAEKARVARRQGQAQEEWGPYQAALG